jgi:hypothetical protein
MVEGLLTREMRGERLEDEYMQRADFQKRK